MHTCLFLKYQSWGLFWDGICKCIGFPFHLPECHIIPCYAIFPYYIDSLQYEPRDKHQENRAGLASSVSKSLPETIITLAAWRRGEYYSDFLFYPPPLIIHTHVDHAVSMSAVWLQYLMGCQYLYSTNPILHRGS